LSLGSRLCIAIAHRDREKKEALMKTQRSIVTLAVGVTLALASAAQADRWGQDRQGDRALPTSKAFAVNHSTTQAQKAARLRAERQASLRAFWRAHGPGGVAPGGVYTPTGPSAATPDSGASGITGTVCAYGDWCG
jgi:hypothetical protein